MPPDRPKDDDLPNAPPTGGDLLDTFGGELDPEAVRVIAGNRPNITLGEATVPEDDSSRTQEIRTVVVTEQPAPDGTMKDKSEEEKSMDFILKHQDLAPLIGIDNETRRLDPKHPLYCLTLSPELFRLFASRRPSDVAYAISKSLYAGEGLLMVEITVAGRPSSKQISQLAAELISELIKLPHCRALAADIIEDCLKTKCYQGSTRWGIKYMSASALVELAALDRDFVDTRFQEILKNISEEPDARIRRVLEPLAPQQPASAPVTAVPDAASLEDAFSTDSDESDEDEGVYLSDEEVDIDSSDQAIEDAQMPASEFESLLNTDRQRAVNILRAFLNPDTDQKFQIGFGNFNVFLEKAVKNPECHDDIVPIIENALAHTSNIFRFSAARALFNIAQTRPQFVEDHFKEQLVRKDHESDPQVRSWLHNTAEILKIRNLPVMEDQDDIPTVVIPLSGDGDHKSETTPAPDPIPPAITTVEQPPVADGMVQIPGGHTFELSPVAAPVANSASAPAPNRWAERRAWIAQKFDESVQGLKEAATEIRSFATKITRDSSASIANAAIAIRRRLASIKMPEMHVRKCTKHETELAIASAIIVITAIVSREIYNWRMAQQDPPRTSTIEEPIPAPTPPAPPAVESRAAPQVPTPEGTPRTSDTEYASANPRRGREEKLTITPEVTLVAQCDYDERASFLCTYKGQETEETVIKVPDPNNPDGPAKKDDKGNPLVKVELVTKDGKHWSRDEVPIVNYGTASDKFDLVFHKKE